MDGLAATGAAPDSVRLRFLERCVQHFVAGQLSGKMVGGAVQSLRLRGTGEDGIAAVFTAAGVQWDPDTNTVSKP